MKKTEKCISDLKKFINKKLEKAKEELELLGTTSYKIAKEAKIEAYEEVLNFIGTIRS